MDDPARYLCEAIGRFRAKNTEGFVFTVDLLEALRQAVDAKMEYDEIISIVSIQGNLSKYFGQDNLIERITRIVEVMIKDADSRK